jgi:hypothetical protein
VIFQNTNPEKVTEALENELDVGYFNFHLIIRAIDTFFPK